MAPLDTDRPGFDRRKPFYEVIFEPEAPADKFFDIFKLTTYISEAHVVMSVLWASRKKITTAFTLERKDRIATGACPGCGSGWHDRHAVYCKHCGTRLKPQRNQEAPQ